MKVYTVLEYKKDPVIHGVFINREHAEAKAEKLKSRHKVKNYIAVLSKRVKGV